MLEHQKYFLTISVMHEERFDSIEALKAALGENPDDRTVIGARLEYDTDSSIFLAGSRSIHELEEVIAKAKLHSKGVLMGVVVRRTEQEHPNCQERNPRTSSVFQVK